MSLVDFQSSHYLYTPFSRSSTFPRCTPFVAQDRLFQISGHLSRSNTSAGAQDSQRNMAHDTTPQQQTASNADKAPAAQNKNCDLCGQDLKFKARPKPEKGGLKNIDDEVPDTENQLVGLPAPPAVPHPDFKHCMPLKKPTLCKYSVFTAGSIEMGAAVQWQKLLAEHLSDLPITVLNPRRGNWDPNDIPKATNEGFAKQVEWELEALEKSSVICFFFDVTTRSPVTLLELGLWAASKKVIVCCNEQYWRSGNVKLVCDRYGIEYHSTFSDFVPNVRRMLKEKMGADYDESTGNIIGENVPSKDAHITSPMDYNVHPPIPSN